MLKKNWVGGVIGIYVIPIILALYAGAALFGMTFGDSVSLAFQNFSLDKIPEFLKIPLMMIEMGEWLLLIISYTAGAFIQSKLK